MKYYCKDGTSAMDRCKELKISYSTFYRRLESGATVDEAFEAREPKYIYKGESLNQFCIKNNIQYSAIMSKMRKRKISLEEAVEEAIKDKKDPKRIRRYVYFWKLSNGKPLAQACREKGVEETHVLTNVYKGMTVDEALERCIARRGRRDGATKYWIGDMSLARYCRENNISKRRAFSYIKSENCTPEEAVRLAKLSKKPTKYKILLSSGKPLSVACREQNLNYNSVYQRYLVRLSVDRAFISAGGRL